RRRSPTASSTGTRSVSMSRSRRCASTCARERGRSTSSRELRESAESQESCSPTSRRWYEAAADEHRALRSHATSQGREGHEEWRSKLLPRYSRRIVEVNEAVTAAYLS